MRLSLATRIFIGYAAVVVTFGAVSVFSVAPFTGYVFVWNTGLSDLRWSVVASSGDDAVEDGWSGAPVWPSPRSPAWAGVHPAAATGSPS